MTQPLALSAEGLVDDSIDMALRQSGTASSLFSTAGSTPGAPADSTDSTGKRRGFNDCPGSPAGEIPASVHVINGATDGANGARDGGASRPADETAGTAAPPGITCMTFDKVRQYNAYTSMIENHSRFHHATHGRHEHMRMGPWRTRKKGHQKAVRPQLFEGDPGP